MFILEYCFIIFLRGLCVRQLTYYLVYITICKKKLIFLMKSVLFISKFQCKKYFVKSIKIHQISLNYKSHYINIRFIFALREDIKPYKIKANKKYLKIWKKKFQQYCPGIYTVCMNILVKSIP